MEGIDNKLADQLAKHYLASLYWFDKDVLGYTDMETDVHLDLCEFIEGRYVDEEGEQPKDFKLCLLPRGSFKSSIVTVGYSVKSIIINPDIRILLANENFSNAKRFASEVRNHFEGNEFLRLVYGDFVGRRDWREDYFTVSRRMANFKEPTLSCAGIDVVKVGMHYDLIIADDLVSQANITTRDQMEKVIDFYRLALSLLEPGGKMIVIGTRWHFNDLYNHIITNEGHRFNKFVRAAYKADGSLWFPSRLSEKFLDEQRKSQGSYHFACTPAGSPVLMADMSIKGIEEIRKGDYVVGFTTGNSKSNGRLVKSKVLAAGKRKAKVVKVTLESGKTIRCTPDHKWYTGRQDISHRLYSEAHIGGKLMRVFDTDNVSKLDYALKKKACWLGGIFDGEGSCCKNHSSIFLHQSQKENPDVVKAIGDTLKQLGYDYGTTWDKRKFSRSFYIRGGVDERIRFINQCDPVRKNLITDQIYNRSAKFVKSKDRVVKIEPEGTQTVYSMQTETGNYVVWGYASKNCQYLNNPIDDDNAVFTKKNIRYYDKSQGLYRPDIDLSGIEEENRPKPYGLADMNLYIHIDPAVSELARGDFSGLVVTAIDPNDFIYVLEAAKKKLKVFDLIDEIFRLFEKYEKYNVQQVLLETQVFQVTLKYFLMDKMSRERKYLPLHEVTHSWQKSKTMRISGLQPRFEFGTIFLGKDMADLEDELLRFPVGQHDDILDALSFGLEVWSKPAEHKSTAIPPYSFMWYRKMANKPKGNTRYIGNEGLEDRRILT